MLRIAGQTAGLIGLKFFVDTHGWPEGVIGLENSTFKEKFLAFFSNFFKFFFKCFFPRATPGISASYL